MVRLLLFPIYVNNHCNNFSHAAFNFYADDTVFYCSFPSVVQALEFLQSVVDVVQSNVTQLKLVLNTEKFKVMLFYNGKTTTY